MSAETRLATSIWILIALLSSAVSSADPEKELADRWLAACVLLRVPAYSGCGVFYTDNELRGDRLVSKGEHRFAAGELAILRRVKIKRRRVEILLDLAEPLLESYRDGPFDLYREIDCKVELRIPRPLGVREPDLSQHFDEVLSELLERHSDRHAAQASPTWNGRIRDPYPEDYEETLYQHALWKADRVNAAVQARLEESIEQAARVLAEVDDEPDFLRGFAAGIEEAEEEHFGNCDWLLTSSRFAFVKAAPGGQSKPWRRGYRAGQEMVFHLEVGRRLRTCYVPPPFGGG